MTTSKPSQPFNGVRGIYSATCDKIAYSTEQYAAASLRLLQAKGRSEQSFYECQQCSMFHLSSRRAATNYRLEVSNSIHVGTTRISIGRKVKATGTTIGMCMTFVTKDGSQKDSIFDMTPEQARTMLDALIEALYDNSEDAAEST